MKYRILSIAAIVAVAVSCSKQGTDIRQDTEGTRFYASIVGTRTSLENKNVQWVKGDRIAIYDGTSSVVATDVSESGSSAIFEVEQPMDATSYLAVYPSDGVKFASLSSVSSTLPSDQVATSGSFAGNLSVMAAYSDSHSLSFKNLCGLLRFTPDFDGITEAVLEGKNGEKLAGDFTVSVSDGAFSVSAGDNASTSVTLKPSTGTFSKGETYYFTVLPQSLDKGFTLKLKVGDDQYVFSGYSKANLASNKILNVGKIAANKVIFPRGGTTHSAYRWDGASDVSWVSYTSSELQVSYKVRLGGAIKGTCPMSYVLNDEDTNFDKIDGISVEQSAEALSSDVPQITYTVKVPLSVITGNYFKSFSFKPVCSDEAFSISGDDWATFDIFNHGGSSYPIYDNANLSIVDGGCNSYRNNSATLPAKIIDGVTTGKWGSYWQAAFRTGNDMYGALELPYYVTVKAATEQEFVGFKFFTGSGANSKDTKAGYIAVSSDGETFTKVCEFDLTEQVRYIDGTFGPYYMSCKPVKAQYVRFYVTASGRMHNGTVPTAVLTELQPIVHVQ